MANKKKNEPEPEVVDIADLDTSAEPASNDAGGEEDASVDDLVAALGDADSGVDIADVAAGLPPV